MFSYTDQKWSQAVDMMEESIRLYNYYRNQTLLCIKQCEEESKLVCLQKVALYNTRKDKHEPQLKTEVHMGVFYVLCLTTSVTSR